MIPDLRRKPKSHIQRSPADSGEREVAVLLWCDPRRENSPGGHFILGRGSFSEADSGAPHGIQLELSTPARGLSRSNIIWERLFRRPFWYNRTMERDHRWLKGRLEAIWQRYFPDVPIANNVFVKFGREASTRLGSIKYGRRKIDPNTIITINGHFKNPEIPEFVVDGVLAHELTHYAHGFCSPHEQAFRHPHKGGVVREELVERGLKDLLKLEGKWVKENWTDFLSKNH